MVHAGTFREYVNQLRANVAQGNATEHTHRPALQTLLQSAVGGIMATNEPKRVECGAPDYVVSRNPGGLIVGYVEAKDIGVSLHDIERDSGRGSSVHSQRAAVQALPGGVAQPAADGLCRVPLVRGWTAARHRHPRGAGLQRPAGVAARRDSRNRRPAFRLPVA